MPSGRAPLIILESQSWSPPDLGALVRSAMHCRGAAVHLSLLPACRHERSLYLSLGGPSDVLTRFLLALLQSDEERFGFQYLSKYYLGAASWSCMVFAQWSPVWAVPVFWHTVSCL